MPRTGFAEAQSVFTGMSADTFVGQVRRFGPHGPAYEVVGVASPSAVTITVIESGESLTYPLVDLVADPMAETVP